MLAADLNSKTGIASKVLGLMGMLGGPVANIAQQGLRAAMTAHNMATIASLVDENASSRTSSRRRRPSRPRLRTSRRSMRRRWRRHSGSASAAPPVSRARVSRSTGLASHRT